MKRRSGGAVGQVGPGGEPQGHVPRAEPDRHVPNAPQVRRSPAKPELEDDDPYEPMFVSLPSPPGFDAMGAMARCVVEEYAMMGFSAPLLMKMFKNPYYQALHRVYETRGNDYVEGLLTSVFGAGPVANDGAAARNDAICPAAIRTPNAEIRNPGDSRA